MRTLPRADSTSTSGLSRRRAERAATLGGCRRRWSITGALVKPHLRKNQHPTVENWCVAKSADAGNADAPESRQYFDIWQFQKAVAAWCVRKTADAENLTPPDSRQHFDVWQFQPVGKAENAQAENAAVDGRLLVAGAW
jgi:hypothetical protein